MPQRTVYASDYALRIAPTDDRDGWQFTRLGSRSWRSWSPTWNRLTSHSSTPRTTSGQRRLTPTCGACGRPRRLLRSSRNGVNGCDGHPASEIGTRDGLPRPLYYVSGKAIYHALSEGVSGKVQRQLHASHGMFTPGQFGMFPEEHSASGIRLYLGSGLRDVNGYDDLFLDCHRPYVVPRFPAARGTELPPDPYKPPPAGAGVLDDNGAAGGRLETTADDALVGNRLPVRRRP